MGMECRGVKKFNYYLKKKTNKGGSQNLKLKKKLCGGQFFLVSFEKFRGVEG